MNVMNMATVQFLVGAIWRMNHLGFFFSRKSVRFHFMRNGRS